MGHGAILREIRSLDPVKDHQRIAFLTSLHEFPWDTTRSLELALFRAFAVAKGTPLLAGTGEFTERTQKRYDDTVLLLAEILEHGYDSPRGRAALRRINQMHGRYEIPNDEFLYVLSTFVFEPIPWNERFGWRPLLPQEKLAAFYFWREIARRMAIRDVPQDYEGLERYYREFARALDVQMLADVITNELAPIDVEKRDRTKGKSEDGGEAEPKKGEVIELAPPKPRTPSETHEVLRRTRTRLMDLDIEHIPVRYGAASVYKAWDMEGLGANKPIVVKSNLDHPMFSHLNDTITWVKHNIAESVAEFISKDSGVEDMLLIKSNILRFVGELEIAEEEREEDVRVS